MGNIFGNCVVKEEMEEDDTADPQRKVSESSQCGDPKVDMDTMTLRHPLTGDELSEVSFSSKNDIYFDLCLHIIDPCCCLLTLDRWNWLDLVAVVLTNSTTDISRISTS